MSVDMDLVLPVGDYDDLSVLVEQVRRAEELGYARVSVPEVTGRDAVSLLAHFAAHTDRIGLSNDVFSPYSRTPALLAQTATTLQELSDGRYRMGLGTSSPPVVERWHGRSFDRPLRTLRECIDVIRQVESGERVDYDGEVFNVGGLRLTCEAHPAPVDVAALGPKAVELAGRFADGWVPQLFTPDGLRERLADFRRGADLGGRDPDDLRTALTLRCCALEDGERAREAARGQVAFMIATYGPYYRESVARQGHEDVTDEIHRLWEAGEREAAVEALPDGLLSDLAAAGTPEAVRETVERFAAVDGLDAVRVGSFGRLDHDARLATMEALAPATVEFGE
ncbi:TIGR04024 family LLM class F420-dependent oxidoreductase [Halomarina ordinaria]|uniref:TIGR04024 family LLM class F420-dependent oxidoreductase n=1 Tax=Halomarina ordinaria TaxID=3033939 RepID=A0ABD5U834_9EURY|nr:TIGR04024 family LLM class F420-dependent oxidoreductase [Halomarina sp. PSRA2]